MKTLKTALVLLLLLALSTPVLADDHGALPDTDYLGSFLRDFEVLTDKSLQLANEVPAEHYGWRPTVKVKSVSEVYVHVAMANFYLTSLLGVPTPEDVQALGREAEAKVTSQEDVLKLYKRSLENVKKAVAHNAELDLEEKIEFFSRQRPKRDVFLQISAHNHEHLGQGIAYVRMMGLVPPWSQ